MITKLLGRYSPTATQGSRESQIQNLTNHLLSVFYEENRHQEM